jgi:outer membrane receptor protein involved in Fe transport
MTCDPSSTHLKLTRRLKRAGVCAFALTVALTGQAVAQQTPAPSQAAASTAPIEEIQITGSRITRTGMTTPTPVTAVTAEELTNMSAGQLVESMSTLPQFFGNQTPQTTGFPSSGASSLNLRGAGANRTLVLLDGRRMVAGNRFGTVDVGGIPEELIRNVETVTGGASAAYGSDAVAGVVNFILDTDYTGIKGHAQGGETQYGDGENWEVGMAAGTDIGEKFHLVASGELFRQAAIDSFDSLRKRDYFKQTSRLTNPDPNGPSEIIRPYAEPTNFSSSGVLIFPKNPDGTPKVPNYEFLTDGTAVPQYFSGVGSQYSGCLCQALDTQTYGVDADDWVLGKNQRASAFAHLDYHLSDNITLYVQGLFGNTFVRQQQASPGITMSGPWQGIIFSGNPYLPANVQALMDENGISSVGFGFLGDNRKESNVGNRQMVLITENDTYTATAGFKATFADNGGFLSGWNANGYFQYGRANQELRFDDGIRVDHLILGLDAVRADDGTIKCRAAVANPGAFGDCVPVDLFGGMQSLSNEAVNYIFDQEKTVESIVEQYFTEVVLSGEVWRGWGAGPVSMAVGGSHRDDHLDQHITDVCDEFVCINGVSTGVRGLIPENVATGGIPGVRPGSVPSGFQGTSNLSEILFSGTIQNPQGGVAGGFTVEELFTELDVPLLAGMTGIQQLDFNGAVRWADYSGSGSIWAWKAGLSWQIMNGLRLRGTQSRDVRAATLQERFDSTAGGANVQDPENNNVTISTASRSGGNPNVNPEKADTTTIGVIYQPSFLSGLSTSLDWYRINIKGAIAQLSAQDVVNGCFRGDQTLCALVERDPVTNNITRISNIFINVANQRVSGVDLELSYRSQLSFLGGGAESLNGRFLGTWLDENSIQNPGAPRDDRAGQIGGGLSLPKYKLTANLTYANGPVSVFLQERWIDGGKLDRTRVESDVAIPGVLTIDDNHVRAAWYTDLRLTYTIDTAGGNSWQIYGDVTNLFNEAPPSVPGTMGRAGTNEFNASLYDTVGRRFVAGVRFSY